MRLRLAAVSALTTVAVALAACGGDGGGAALTDPASITTQPAKTATAAKGSSGEDSSAPAALRANVSDADTLSGEGKDGLQQRLAKLRGHPVVVNQWASWCPPCRAEFPYFADAVAEHGDKVAFLGLDFTDDRDAANRLLDEIPPGFASIFDPKGDATRSLGGGRVSPSTFFIAPDGKVEYAKLGGYPDAESLDADIRRYALG